MSLLNHFASRLIAISERRSPDFTVGGEENPYLRRWWLIPRNRFFNVYLHHFLRSDDDRALHDHPWHNVSILLRGAYMEVLPGHEIAVRQAGDVVARGPAAAHRIQLANDDTVTRVRAILPGFTRDVWTLFITGPRLRTWGFHCPQGWVPHTLFLDPANPGLPGKGCNQ